MEEIYIDKFISEFRFSNVVVAVGNGKVSANIEGKVYFSKEGEEGFALYSETCGCHVHIFRQENLAAIKFGEHRWDTGEKQDTIEIFAEDGTRNIRIYFPNGDDAQLKGLRELFPDTAYEIKY